ncbi:MAG: hypothetical protein ACLQVY_29255 [Limisphaerales bacterium]
MDNASDMDLLRQYAEGNSDAAFAALVARHVNLVYGYSLLSPIKFRFAGGQPRRPDSRGV